MKRLKKEFYSNNALFVAKYLLGKTLVRKHTNGEIKYYKITATEAYFGEEDKACHAHKGRTKRTEILYHSGGFIYVYLIYGIHWLFNIVTGEENFPQAVLICGLSEIKGSGRVGKELAIDKSFYGENIITSGRIWIEENDEMTKDIIETPRIGIDYAGEWKDKLWRFEIKK
jgi:DNA-3-methyladenine glycosylase